MAINQNTIPGFPGLTTGASNLIKNLMSGQLSTATKRSIYDSAAERGVAGGMPGSSGYANSLFSNATLRDIGRTSEQQQQQGFQDLLAMIAGYSGTVSPTTGQDIQQQQVNIDAQNSELQRQLSQRQDRRAQGEYLYRYGPKRFAKGTFRNGMFTTDMGQSGDFGATTGAKGYDFRLDPRTGATF